MRLFKSINRIALVFTVSLIALTYGSGQTKPSAPTPRPYSLTGRVVDESSHSIPNVTVRIGDFPGLIRYRQTISDEEGRFRFDVNNAGPYKIDVQNGGYWRNEDTAKTYYKAGDSVTIVLTKGGVITGSVTNSISEPLIEVTVTAIRIRGIDSGSAQPLKYLAGMTDDRGIYRLYGLPPGIYVVMAGGGRDSSVPSYQDDAPTYYPSATRESAAQVTVQKSEEVSGVDIRYRAELGRTLSGLISEPTGKGPFLGVTIDLFSAISNELVAETYCYEWPDSRSFEFHGVPEGEYYLRAQALASRGNNNAFSRAKRVVVKGLDVSDVELTLRATGSIEGRIQLKPLSKDERNGECESERNAVIGVSLIFVRSADPEMAKTRLAPFDDPVGAARDNGQFTISNIEPGRYYVGARPPNDRYFVLTIIHPAGVKNKTSIDVGRDGLVMTEEQRVTGLNVVLAEGAAALHGRILPGRENEALPKSLHVYLVPAERESANDALRFYDATANPEGGFDVNSIAPGRYWTLVQPFNEKRSRDGQSSTSIWDEALRSKLRRAAARANHTIEFHPCDRVANYALSYIPPKVQTPVHKP